jgi:hypothetical protein
MDRIDDPAPVKPPVLRMRTFQAAGLFTVAESVPRRELRRVHRCREPRPDLARSILAPIVPAPSSATFSVATLDPVPRAGDRPAIGVPQCHRE